MNTPCSVRLLESALDGKLPKEDEDALHQHLEECEACSAALEQMAGGQGWCREAVSLLVRDKLGVAAPTRDPWSEVDFTVEHLEPTDEPNMLGRLGGYDVLEIIGRGGMGVVLKGFDRELKRTVAIKVLAPHLAQNSLARKRFAREAQAAAAVVHPHVLAIYQVQPSGRLPFLVMPLVAGESLAERLKAQGTLELKEILRIGMQAAAGLAAAHEQGLVHRDVKPANVLLEMGVERAVLTDFGLARAADDVTLTRWGVIAGTPQYMSPEQARGEPLDGRSDLFSLGCVLYEMATGVSPFRSDSVMATIRRLVDDPPQAMSSLNPELPPWFVALVERLLEKNPLQRFKSAQEVSELLEGCLAHVQQPASVPLPAGLPKPASRRGWRSNLNIKGVLTMIGTLGVGLLGVLLITANPPDIEGEWTGEDWGTVALKKISDAEYTGTYTDTFGKKPGEIHLRWSRIERRFNGTWREGQSLAFSPDGKALAASTDRFGELSVRLVGDEIRGAQTTDPKSMINPATPRLADLAWRRAASQSSLWMDFGVTPAPVSPLTAKGLEWLGLHLRPITKGDFRDKNALAKYRGGLDVTFVRTHGPGETAGIQEGYIIIGLQGWEIISLEDLDFAMRDAVEKCDRGDIDALQFYMLRNGETVRVKVPFPVRQLDLGTRRSSAGTSRSGLAPNREAGSPPNATGALPQLKAQTGVIDDRADRFLMVPGTMQPAGEISHVWAETSGTVKEVLVEPGQHVNQGQAIVKLDSPLVKDQLETNQDLVKQLQTRLASIKASPRQAAKEVVDIARAEFEKAQALAEFARLEARRFAKLKDANAAVVTETEIANAHATLVAREADEKIAKARLDALVEQPSQYQKELEETEKQLQVAKERLAESRQLLETCTVRAPADGMVLSLRAVTGQSVLPQSKQGAREICQIADMAVVEIRVQVAPADASQIDPGQDIEVQFDHQGTTVRWTGHIVLPDPEHIGNPVTVRVANPDWRLYRAGATVTLRFKLRAATLGSAGVQAPVNGLVVTDLKTGNTAIIDQPVTVSVQPKPGASPAAVLEVAISQLQHAEVYVQQQKANLQFAEADLMRAEAKLSRSKEERQELEDQYHRLVEEYGQKLVKKSLVDQAVDMLQLAQTAEQTARAELDASQAKHEATKDRLRRAEAELQAATQKVEAAKVQSVGGSGPHPASGARLEREGEPKETPSPRSGSSSHGSGSSSVSKPPAPDKHAIAIAKAELEKARAAVELARSNAKRMGDLAKERVVGKDLVVEAGAKVRTAEADEKAAKARLDALLAPPLPVLPAPRDLTGFRQHVGQTYLFWVPANVYDYSLRVDSATGLVIAEYPGHVWGTDIYTDDSPLAAAAVNAGLLVPGLQAVLRVTILPGQDSYEGSTRRGVTSASWGAWGGSYRIEQPTADDIRRIRAADDPKPVRDTVSPQPAKDGDAAVRGEVIPPPVSAPSSNGPAAQPPDKHALAIALAELEKAQATVELAKSNADRLSELAIERFVNKGYVDEAAAKVRIAEADEKAAQARLDALLSPESEQLALAIARVELEKARADAQLARLIVTRLEELFKTGAVARETVTKAEADARKAEAHEKMVQLRLDYLRELISRHEKKAAGESPAGQPVPADKAKQSKIDADRRPARPLSTQHPTQRKIAQIGEFPGRVVEMDDLLTARAPEKSVAVRFEMDKHSYDRYEASLGVGKTKEFGDSFVAGLAGEKGFPLSGTLAFVSQEVSNSEAMAVYGFLPNPKRSLAPGMSVRVRIVLGPPRLVLEVPAGALYVENDQAYAWVVNEQRVVQPRAVRLGAKDKDRDMCIVEEGLNALALIVVEGTEGLAPGDYIGPPPAEQQGSLVLDPKYLVRVCAPLAGEIGWIGGPPNSEKTFRCGDRVRKGDLLAVVRSQDDAEKQSAKLDIRAPIDGMIVEKNCQVGDIVDPSMELFTIASLDIALLPRVIDGRGIRISFDPEKLKRAGIRASDALEMIESFCQRSQKFSLSELQNLVLIIRDEVPIKLGDVAAVEVESTKGSKKRTEGLKPGDNIGPPPEKPLPRTDSGAGRGGDQDVVVVKVPDPESVPKPEENTGPSRAQSDIAERLSHLHGIVLQANKTDAEVIDALFLVALGRQPTYSEREHSAKQLKNAVNRESGCRDILFALVNSNDFLQLHNMEKDVKKAAAFTNIISEAWERTENPSN